VCLFVEGNRPKEYIYNIVESCVFYLALILMCSQLRSWQTIPVIDGLKRKRLKLFRDYALYDAA
jgi:hypothetical protein